MTNRWTRRDAYIYGFNAYGRLLDPHLLDARMGADDIWTACWGRTAEIPFNTRYDTLPLMPQAIAYDTKSIDTSTRLYFNPHLPDERTELLRIYQRDQLNRESGTVNIAGYRIRLPYNANTLRFANA